MLIAAASDDVAIAFIELGAMVLGLAVLARLSDRIGVSPVPAYLLAGLVFGDGGLAAPLAEDQLLNAVDSLVRRDRQSFKKVPGQVWHGRW